MRIRQHQGLGWMLTRRLLVLPIVLFAVALMTYGLVAVSPYDATKSYGSTGSVGLTSEAQQELARIWGVDQPVYLQFFHWLGNVFQGDLGYSRMLGGQPVLDQLIVRIQPTAILVASSLLLVLICGLLAGVLAATFRDGWFDRLVRAASYCTIAAPSFWVGLLLLWVFSTWLGWLPAGGTADLRAVNVSGIDPRYMILPTVSLAATQFGWFAMFVRNQMLEVMRDDYVRFAESLGLSRGAVLLRHALPNALLPFLTLFGTNLAEIVGGTVLVETVFAWPGVGQLAVQAAQSVDLPLLVAITLAGSVLVVIGNLVADICYRLVDPRVREA